ncbi:MAG: hypothetical protein V1703_00135, partial [Candidatus Altiarchaeota archaeon]
MPYEYNIPQLMRFHNAYEYFGTFLRTFSQPYTCEIMEGLIKNKELTVTEIRSRLATGVPNFLVSKALTSLKNRNIIDKIGNLYTLKNQHFYNKLSQTTEQIKNLLDIKSTKEVTCDDIRDVAACLNHAFFDDTSNILVHILLKKALSFNEIVDIFRSNHGYIARVKLRYHLKSRKLRICGKDLDMFTAKAKKYAISAKGKRLHEMFDTFIVEYETGTENWIKEVWNEPIKNLVQEQVPMVYIRDPLHKVLKVMGKASSAIVFSNEMDGIITIKDVMNKIGHHISAGGFTSDIIVKDIMTPLTPDKVLSGEITLAKLYAKEKGLHHRQYIVRTGVETYSILDLASVIKKLNEI